MCEEGKFPVHRSIQAWATPSVPCNEDAIDLGFLPSFAYHVTPGQDISNELLGVHRAEYS